MPPLLRKWLGRRQRRVEGIRARLGFSMALSLLPFILLGLIQVRGEYQQQTTDLKADLQLAAERSVREAESAFNRAGILLSIIAPEGQAFDCNARLNGLVNRIGEVEALYRFGTDGTVLCASHEKEVARFGDVRDSDWFKALAQGRSTSHIFLQTDAEGSQLALAYRATRPLGGFDGVLVAVIPTSIFSLSTQDIPLPPDTQTGLFDDQGRALTPIKGLTFGQSFPPLKNWLKPHSHEAGAVLRAKGADGVNRLYAAAKLENQNVYAVISAPAASPWFWAQTNPIRFLMLPLAAWLTAFAAAMLASERIVIRWLDYLDRIAAIYARGRYTIRPVQAENAPLEIRHLARTMDELAENITRRDAALTEALHEKDALLREIHHRVKNNLQIISSLLSMQQRVVEDPAARAALGDTRQRISALALIYRTLYQGEDVRHADAEVFLTELVGHLVASESLRGPLVKSSIEADPLSIDPEKLAPMALWLVEAVSNAQKHAFAGRGGELKVRFKVNGKTSTLEVEDDGPGMNDVTSGVGVTLMTAFAKQLRGTATTRKADSGGTIASLVFETPASPETAVPSRSEQDL
ncbi:sensor histidine kinase PhyK [Brevundimonas terrae]|uniref:histidine kinase n=1 Tax=Brevundimonas terrae TaxID=363631 RepID=A0ABP3HX75_9CAUL|nr:sensor histidine kinase [Brevundimonas terrae]NIJ25771.1 two-component sensor histidine kinase [Brevundimonas terrae]